jgi:hypothetical protein
MVNKYKISKKDKLTKIYGIENKNQAWYILSASIGLDNEKIINQVINLSTNNFILHNGFKIEKIQ